MTPGMVSSEAQYCWEKSPCSSQLCHLQQDGLIFKLVFIVTVGHHAHS